MTGPFRTLALASTLALSLGLGACSDAERVAQAPPINVAPSPSPAPSPTPTPSPSPAGFDVGPCLNQIVGAGRSVANLVVPDVVRLDLNQPAGFPNGRRYLDPVVDVTLAVILLDLRVHSAATFASIPVNPNQVDQPLPTTFPFLAPPIGNPPIASGAGSNFQFRTDPASAYVRLDRAGMPAVATALIFPNPAKNAYNDDNPAIDVTGKWVPNFVEQLQFYHSALADDFQRLGLTACARRI
jgi:hypothetical protein